MFQMSRLHGLIGAAGLIAASLLTQAYAQEVKVGDLVVSHAWTRATPGGARVAGGYLTIENKGSSTDKLIDGSTPVAGKLEVHEMSVRDGVMKMQPVAGGLVIEPGKTVKLAPGGYHLMLTDIKQPFKEGDKIPVTLQFEKAGKLDISLDVQGIGASTPPGNGSMMMKGAPDHSHGDHK